MKQFDINVKDEVGALGNIAETISKRNINIVSISSERRSDGSANLKIVTSDEDQTRDILDAERYIYKESEFIVVTLKDKPGELFRITKMLSDAGINIESLYLLDKREGSTDLAMIVNKMEEAEAQIKNFSYQV